MAADGTLVQSRLRQVTMLDTAAMLLSVLMSAVVGSVNAPLGMVMVSSADALNCSHFRSYSLSNTRSRNAINFTSFELTCWIN